MRDPISGTRVARRDTHVGQHEPHRRTLDAVVVPCGRGGHHEALVGSICGQERRTVRDRRYTPRTHPTLECFPVPVARSTAAPTAWLSTTETCTRPDSAPEQPVGPSSSDSPKANPRWSGSSDVVPRWVSKLGRGAVTRRNVYAAASSTLQGRVYFGLNSPLRHKR